MNSILRATIIFFVGLIGLYFGPIPTGNVFIVIAGVAFVSGAVTIVRSCFGYEPKYWNHKRLAIGFAMYLVIPIVPTATILLQRSFT